MWRHSLLCLVLIAERGLAFIFSPSKGSENELSTNNLDYEAYHGEIENTGIVDYDTILMEQKTEDDFDDKVRRAYSYHFISLFHN